MTTITTSPAGRSRTATIAVWSLRVLLGAAFLLFGAMKLSGRAEMVAEFDAVGLGQWFRFFVAALELLCGIAVLVPALSVFAALLMLAVDVGAFVAQVTVLHVDWIHTVVLAAPIAVLVYLQRDHLGRVGRRREGQGAR